MWGDELAHPSGLEELNCTSFLFVQNNNEDWLVVLSFNHLLSDLTCFSGMILKFDNNIWDDLRTTTLPEIRMN